MATANANRDALITGAGNYGIKIAKSGHDVATAEPKDQIFNSKFACLKILQYGKISAVNSSQIALSNAVAFPLVALVFMQDSSGENFPVASEFDADYLYLPGGEDAGSYYYYFICYA